MKTARIVLKFILILLILSNIGGVYKILFGTEAASKDYTFLTAGNAIYIVVVPIISIIGLVGIWLGKRWGLLTSIIVFIFIISIDVAYQVWAHTVLVSVGFAALMFLCWKSKLFAWNEKTPNG